MELTYTDAGARVVLAAAGWLRRSAVLVLDRQGVWVNGERIALDSRVFIDERFVTLDARGQQWVLPHTASDADQVLLHGLLERCLTQARAAHGEGSAEVPEELRRDRQ